MSSGSRSGAMSIGFQVSRIAVPTVSSSRLKAAQHTSLLASCFNQRWLRSMKRSASKGRKCISSYLSFAESSTRSQLDDRGIRQPHSSSTPSPPSPPTHPQRPDRTTEPRTNHQWHLNPQHHESADLPSATPCLNSFGPRVLNCRYGIPEGTERRSCSCQGGQGCRTTSKRSPNSCQDGVS